MHLACFCNTKFLLSIIYKCAGDCKGRCVSVTHSTLQQEHHMFKTYAAKYGDFQCCCRASGFIIKSAAWAKRYVVQVKKEGVMNVNSSICASLSSLNFRRKVFSASAVIYA